MFDDKSEISIKYRSEKSEKFIESIQKERNQYWYNFKFKDSESGKGIVDLDSREHVKIALDLVDWLTELEKVLQEKRREDLYFRDERGPKVRGALVELLRKGLPLSEDELLKILDWSIMSGSNHWRAVPQMIKQLQRFIKNRPLTENLTNKVRQLIEVVVDDYQQDEQTRKQSVKLKELIAESFSLPLIAGEAWADAAVLEIGSLSAESKNAWGRLLNHCQASSGSAPNGKWTKSAQALLDEIGFEEFKSHVSRWFPLVDKPRTIQIATWSEWSPDPNLMLDDVNADILKGLVWLCGLREDKEIARALTALAISAYKKVPMIGPRSVRVGNACVWSLGRMGMAGVGQLAILKLKVKFGTAQKGIEKALQETAKAVGLPAEELEEMSVPNYGLAEVGFLREDFGECAAELVVTGTNAAELRWFNRDGKQQKSVPAFVKENRAEELKELNDALKDIKKMLPAQRDRLENLYLEEKRWKYDVWRERYLDHPLVGTIARRLIWRFDQATTAIFEDGKMVDGDGRELTFFADSEVELWHPLHSAIGEVLAWREFLESREIRQPFKQAHREIYVLTDAERRTEVYSNRFAAHIIKQHQFNALCAQRNWKNQLRLMVDDTCEPPARRLPKHDLRAEFWVESVGENYGTDTTETGTYLYLATDQIRFYRFGAELHYAHATGGGYSDRWNQAQDSAPVPLDQIPPLVFSEIMRDVDLFVGVASIGNDPNWADNGRDRHNDYWYSYSFGDLSATAKTRKEILERLVPRLKIGGVCSFEDKFLIVRGEIRTYKIHLGSGNILMSPNDQYLCIVPSGGTESFGQGKVFLPFEGDRTLSIILSKAFMLAEDKKITDPTIARQIN